MKLSKSRYWKSILLSLLLIGILPVLLLGFFSYERSSQMIQKKVVESNRQVLELTQNRVEESLRLVYNYYTLIAGTDPFNAWMDMNLSYQDFESILDIQSALINLQNLQSIVLNAHLVNTEHDWIVSNDGACPLSESYHYSVIKALLDKPGTIFWDTVYPETDDTVQGVPLNTFVWGRVSLVVKGPYHARPKGAFIVNLSGFELDRFFEYRSNSGRLIVLDDDNRVLYHPDDALIGAEAAGIPALEPLLAGASSEGYYVTPADRSSGLGEQGIAWLQSDYNGWKYVTVYDIRDITRDSRSIRTATFLIVGLLVLLLCGVALIGSRQLYKPVDSVYQAVRGFAENESSRSFPPAESSREGPRDELAYIKRNVTHLAQSRERLETQLTRQVGQLEELLLTKLANGDLSQEEIDAKVQSMGRLDQWRVLALVGIQVDSIENAEDRTKDADIPPLLVNNLLESTLRERFVLQPILLRQVVMFMIGGTQEGADAFKEDVFSFARQTQDFILERLGMRVSFGVSRPFTRFRDTQVASKEVLEALLCRHAVGSDAILFYEDVQPGKYIRAAYPKNMEDALVEAINAGDQTRADGVLDVMVDAVFGESAGFSEHMFYMNQLLIAVLRILQDSGVAIGTVFGASGSLMEELNTQTNIAAMKKWFRERVIAAVIPILQEQRMNRNRPVLDEIRRMVEEEYDTDLSLEGCAARLNYHPSHVWRILKSEWNITFSDLLSQQRLKVAKQWLVDTQMSVNEIAARLQYTNTQNFIRYFKKQEGITPGQYREQADAGAGSASR